MPPVPIVFSFSGSGWAAVYHLGAVRAIQQRPELARNATYCGASGGALAAAVASLGGDVLPLMEFVVARSVRARRNPLELFRLRSLVVEGADVALRNAGHADGDDWAIMQARLRGRCEVFITGLPKFDEIVEREFATKRDLVQSLCASCCIPPFAGMPFRDDRGRLVVDGGFRNMVPRRKEPGVVTVAPFVLLPYRVHVSPAAMRCAVPVRWALLPPDAVRMRAMFYSGYRDMDAVLDSMGYARSIEVAISSTADRNHADKVDGALPQLQPYLMRIAVASLVGGTVLLLGPTGSRLSDLL